MEEPRIWCGYDLATITEEQFQRCVKERRLSPNGGTTKLLRSWSGLPGPTEDEVLARLGRGG